MNNQVIVQYVGFQAKPLVREYIFAVREPLSEPSQYTVTIANEAFVSRRARYQDGPDICSLRLRRELVANANHPPAAQLCVTDAELAAYHNDHTPKPLTGFRPRRAED